MGGQLGSCLLLLALYSSPAKILFPKICGLNWHRPGMKNRKLSKFRRSTASRARPICADFFSKKNSSIFAATMVTRGAESGQAYKCSASLRFTDFRCGMVLRGRVSHRHRGSRAHVAVPLCCHGRSICAALVSFLFTALGRGALGGWVEALVFPHCLSCTTKTTTSYGVIVTRRGRAAE